MTIKTTFKGKVINFRVTAPSSTVTLEEVGTNKIIETDADTQKLRERDIGQDDTFEICIYETNDGKAFGEIKKL